MSRLLLVWALLCLSICGALAQDSSWYSRHSVPGNSIKAITNGEVLWSWREYLVRNATQSIFMTSFAIDPNNDPDGASDKNRYMLGLLCEKARAGLDVRLMVDEHGSTTLQGYSDWLRDPRTCGMKIIFYANSSFGADAIIYTMHEKFLVVDNKHMIAGSSNYGNSYVRWGMPDGNRFEWDLLIAGPLACVAHNKFMSNWISSMRLIKNAQYDPFTSGGKSEEYYRFYFGDDGSPNYGMQECDPKDPGLKSGEKSGVFTYHNPYYRKRVRGFKGPSIEDHLVESVNESQKGEKVRLWSPYLVLTPRFEKTLIEAVGRGVDVSIITNSDESSDEPLAQTALYLTISKALKNGVKVYLWTPKGKLMHRKAGIFDHQISYVGSYNFDRRGQYKQSESGVFSNDPVMYQLLADEFDANLKECSVLTQKFVDKKVDGMGRFEKFKVRRILDHI